jgi:hypothetical protein
LKVHYNRGTVNMVYGKVVTPKGRFDITLIRAIAQEGYYDYTSMTKVFEMKAPGASAMQGAGVEGKASG